MRKTLKKLWHDPVWSKVIAASIIAAIGLVFAYLAGLFPIALKALKITWSWLTKLTPVWNWILALWGIVTLAVVIWFSYKAWLRSQCEAWRKYRADVFERLAWRWEYTEDGDIVGLQCYCPKCACEIAGGDFLAVGGYNCENCDYKNRLNIDIDDLRPRIERLIRQKIDSGEWNKPSR